jgi:nitrogenase molybdenum-iron protein NifN
MQTNTVLPSDYRPAQNACKLCAPLGAVLAFKGVAGAVPLLHGSQGCATYIRRYLISHFREPVDVASSSFNEETTVFGGGPNLKVSIDNITSQYDPTVVGIATTCLSETMGEDVAAILHEYRNAHPSSEHLPETISVSTPSYRGTHIDGFHAAILALVQKFAQSDIPPGGHINILPGMASPIDLRHLKEILTDFSLPYIMLPDYSVTLDGPQWETYQKIPAGGTSIAHIANMGNAKVTLELGRAIAKRASAGQWLQKNLLVPCQNLGLPIGVHETDQFMDVLEEISGKQLPVHYEEERGRLIDAYVDGHKYVSGARAVVFGEEDLVTSLVAFLCEIGIQPILCATGEKTGQLNTILSGVCLDTCPSPPVVLEGADFVQMLDVAETLHPDIVIGNSKGVPMARKCGVPHIRVGFPVHDRFGSVRISLFGYRGTQYLFDRIVNALIEKKETELGYDYAYM